MRGRFVAFEGGEASGKSTQAALLAETWGAVLTREPGGTPLGERIRALVLEVGPVLTAMSDRTEALLLAADRAQHVAEVVRPALEQGHDVVTDRYLASSLAYQGFGRGLPVDEVRALSTWATGGLWPDLTVLLDVPVDVARARLRVPRDRMEAEDTGFHHRVVDGFRALATEDPDRWLVLDGTAGVVELAAEVRRAVDTRLPPR